VSTSGDLNSESTSDDTDVTIQLDNLDSSDTDTLLSTIILPDPDLS